MMKSMKYCEKLYGFIFNLENSPENSPVTGMGAIYDVIQKTGSSYAEQGSCVYLCKDFHVRHCLL